MEQTEQKEIRAMVMFMICAIFGQCVGVKILQMILEDVPGYMTARVMESVGIVLLIIFCKFTPFRIYRTGLTASGKEVRRTLIRCGCICIGMIVCFLIARVVMTQFNDEIRTRPWFYPYFNIHMRWLYPFTAVLQEFFAKGVIQESMKRIFGTEHIWLSIVACSLFLGILHMGYPLYYMFAAAMLSIVTGLIYEKDRNIWGCVMIHFCLGFLPRAMGLK